MRTLVWIVFILALPCLAAAGHTVLNKSEKLTLREKPVKTAPAVAGLIAYQPVEVLKSEKGWSQVKTTQNQTGWVPSSTLTENAFIYVDDDKINARRGPGNDPATGKPYEVWMQYGRKFPLRVLDSSDNGWLMVMDYDGDRSWIDPKAVKASPHYIITKDAKVNVRKGMGIGQEMAFIAEKGVILQALEEKDGWLRVKATDGDEGWLSAKTVFGWNEVAPPKTGADAKAATDKTDAKTGGKKATGKAAGKAAAKTGEADESAPADKEAAKPAKNATGKGAATKGATTKSTAKKSSAKASDDESAGGKTATTKSTAKKKSSASTTAAAKKKANTDDANDAPAAAPKKTTTPEQ